MVEVTEGAVTKVASADITVEPGPLDHVSIEPATATLTVTGEQGFTAAAFDQFDNPIPELTFAFASDDRQARWTSAAASPQVARRVSTRTPSRSR